MGNETMIDMQVMEQHITGLNAKLAELRENEKVFIKASGMDEEAAKFVVETDVAKNKLATLKEEKKTLTAQKNAAVAVTAKSLGDKMTQMLPMGYPIFTISEEGNAFIGWFNGAIPIPYDGLSGGEKVMFDAALCKALGANVIIQEAAELDGKAIVKDLIMMESSGDMGQFIVSTCHPISDPDDRTGEELEGLWRVIDLGGGADDS